METVDYCKCGDIPRILSVDIEQNFICMNCNKPVALRGIKITNKHPNV